MNRYIYIQKQIQIYIQIEIKIIKGLQQMLKIVDNYTLTEYIGRGEYGKVYKGFNIDTKIDVAVKMVPLSKFEQFQKLIELTRNQIQTLRLLQDNINIIKFVQMIKTNRYIYLVYQYCEGGTLQDIIRGRGHLPEKQALRIFKQLINAFKTLYQNNVLHRDVKPNNIFFKSGHLKLADFGFCKKLKSSDDLSQTSLGSPLYMAPQVLNGDVYDSRADVWSVGIVLYEMLFGKCPYGDCNIKQLLNIYSSDKHRIEMATQNIFISPYTEHMLRRMLEKDQLKRISWQDFLYEYDIDEYGNILRREKDFEYDLMKLMKKNSSQSQSQIRPKGNYSSKIDWSKITERNSSVHSQQLNYKEKSIRSATEMDQILNLNKRVKKFQFQYDRRLQLSILIDQMLSSPIPYHYSSSICYFLIFNLEKLIRQGLKKLQQFIGANRELLSKATNQNTLINKMLVVFKNEDDTLKPKLNSIKMSLLLSPDFTKNSAKYPDKHVTTTQLNKFVQAFQEKNQGITSFFVQNNSPQFKSDLVYLTRVLWGINLIKITKQQISLSFLIKPETPVKQISKLLNKYIILVTS